jgi:hypothetical protein
MFPLLFRCNISFNAAQSKMASVNRKSRRQWSALRAMLSTGCALQMHHHRRCHSVFRNTAKKLAEIGREGWLAGTDKVTAAVLEEKFRTPTELQGHCNPQTDIIGMPHNLYDYIDMFLYHVAMQHFIRLYQPRVGA